MNKKQKETIVTNESISQLILALDQAQSPEQVTQLEKSIAEIGESAVPELLQYSKQLYPRPGRRIVIVRILQKMGYPANQSAIRYLVTQASNTNSSGWDIALKTLIDIGKPVIPEIGDALQFYSQDLFEYHPEIQGLCILLEKMGSPVIDSLLPNLLQLLEAGTDEDYVTEYALWPIRKIGSPKADVAIPTLGQIISSKRDDKIRISSIDALDEFDISATRSIIPVLKECLDDESESVRDSAQKILEKINSAQ